MRAELRVHRVLGWSFCVDASSVILRWDGEYAIAHIDDRHENNALDNRHPFIKRGSGGRRAQSGRVGGDPKRRRF